MHDLKRRILLVILFSYPLAVVLLYEVHIIPDAWIERWWALGSLIPFLAYLIVLGFMEARRDRLENERQQQEGE